MGEVSDKMDTLTLPTNPQVGDVIELTKERDKDVLILREITKEMDATAFINGLPDSFLWNTREDKARLIYTPKGWVTL